MNDNNIKLALETLTPTTEKLGLRFMEVMEKGDASWADIVKTESSARYSVIKDGSEGNVQAMLSNEKELGLAAFSFLDKLFSKGIALAEKGMDLKAMSVATNASEERALSSNDKARAHDLAARTLALEEKRLELEVREQTLREKKFEEQAKDKAEKAEAHKSNGKKRYEVSAG